MKAQLVCVVKDALGRAQVCDEPLPIALSWLPHGYVSESKLVHHESG